MPSLPRERLLEHLQRFWDHRLALVVAPAGSGKTTFLAQLAAAAETPVAYSWVEPSDAEPEILLRQLGSSLAQAVPGVSGKWRSAEEGALELERSLPARTLLLVDDFHAVHGTEAEAAFEQLLAYAPATLATVVASRARPGFNWSRMLVAGTLLQIGVDDLRFRSWEVEQLFCGFYGEPLPPEDLADLTRRTEGWAAALKLFHLATRGRPASERRSVLSALGGRSGLARDYLARNVLDSLDEELRGFLVTTCVFPRLSGPLCDELLGTTGSGRVLRKLEARQLFTYELGDGSYRYHETLRSHLEDLLIEQLGEPGARAEFARAGELLEGRGLAADALVAYCRGEAWDAVDRLLGRDGERIVNGGPVHLDALPTTIVGNDPWLLLASARKRVAAGRLRDALAPYREVERRSPGSAAADIARRELRALSLWLEPRAPVTPDALGLLRAATIDQPREARVRAVTLATPEGTLVAGLAALLAGDCADAASLLVAARETLPSGSSLTAGAQVAIGAALLLSGAATGAAEARRAAELAESTGFPWLAGLAEATLALADGHRNGAGPSTGAASSEPDAEGWPAALIALARGLGALRAGECPVEALAATELRLHGLGAGVPAVWARAALALAQARAGHPDAAATALDAERLARLRGVAAGQALALQALAELDDDPSSEYRNLAGTLAADCSLALPAPPIGAPGSSTPRVEIRCFGGFEVTIDGRAVDLALVKPRARSVLAMLALRAGAPIHREVLMEALWPGSPPRAAARTLHVLISTLRRALEPGRARGDASLIRRDGDAYRLALPEDAAVDLVAFEVTVSEARNARGAGDVDRSLAACRQALEHYRGELLPLEGPVDWIVHERERRAAEACEVAALEAELLLQRGETREAVAVCERGLAMDPYDGVLWRLCAAAHEQAGDVGGAARTRRRHERLLVEIATGGRID